MNKQTKFALLTLLISSAVIFLDRFSKVWVIKNIPLYSQIAPIPTLYPWFSFVHSTNSGVAFGLFQGGTLLFTIIAAIAVIAIAIYSIQSSGESALLAISLGLMLGGAAGNLWDRLAYGSVVDFILVRASDTLVWPTFNLADSSIVVGTGLLILYLFLDERRSHRESNNAQQPAA